MYIYTYLFSIFNIFPQDAYTGSFVQNPTPFTTVTTSGQKLSNVVPSDVECFKTDDSLLTTTTFDATSGNTHTVTGKRFHNLIIESLTLFLFSNIS
jgi:hypothetical protein